MRTALELSGAWRQMGKVSEEEEEIVK